MRYKAKILNKLTSMIMDNYKYKDENGKKMGMLDICYYQNEKLRMEQNFIAPYLATEIGYISMFLRGDKRFQAGKDFSQYNLDLIKLNYNELEREIKGKGNY